MDTLSSLRRANVSWILRWFMASRETELDIEITETKRHTVYYSPTKDRTVILTTKDTHHLMQFIEGTQKNPRGYFTQNVDFNHVVTAPAELIVKYVGEGIDKQTLIGLVKGWASLLD